MHENLRRLRDAILRRDRSVEVDANGTVHEMPPPENEEAPGEEPQSSQRKATKLASRTFAIESSHAPVVVVDQDDLAAVTARLTPHAHVQVIVPSRDRDGRPIDFVQLLRTTEDALITITGSVTTWAAGGRWIGSTGVDIREPVAPVGVFLPDVVTADHVETIVACIERIAREGNQEAVAVVIDGRLVLVRASARPRAVA